VIGAISRRTFLVASAAASAAAASRATAAGLERPTLVAVDHRLDAAQLRLLVRKMGRPDLVLGHDLVRVWRDQLSQSLRRGTRLAAYTRWDLSLLLADMAREDALALQQTRITRSVLLTEISSAAA
jgi:hypothetical protein